MHSNYVLKGILVHFVMMEFSIHNVNKVGVAQIVIAPLSLTGCGKALA